MDNVVSINKEKDENISEFQEIINSIDVKRGMFIFFGDDAVPSMGHYGMTMEERVYWLEKLKHDMLIDESMGIAE